MLSTQSVGTLDETLQSRSLQQKEMADLITFQHPNIFSSLYKDRRAPLLLLLFLEPWIPLGIPLVQSCITESLATSKQVVQIIPEACPVQSLGLKFQESFF